MVVGSSNTDMTIRGNHLPVPGETILGGDFLMNPGGKGANQAVAAARLGGDVYFVAKVGNDVFGKSAIELYQKDGVHTDYVFTDDKLPSGVALIMVDENGQNCISVASGANGGLTPADVEKAKGVIAESDLVLMQLETPIDTIEYVARLANGCGKKVILNPAPAQPLSGDLLKNLYMIIPNETEAQILSGVEVVDEKSAKKAAQVISDKGVDIVLITLGSKGALVKEGSEFYIVPSRKVKAVDATAAGDTFCGALCVALAEGKSIREAVAFANCSAGISVTRMGAQASVPTRDEVNQLMKA